MSGICGVVALDGRPVGHEEVGAMVRALERRGPDATEIWRQGRVALGHTLLATTPEALVETLPLTHGETGCTLTADARLDNRDQLLAVFGLEQRGRVVGDGELILRAYLKWGRNCPEKLLGDFAFVIWDPREQHLFGARDQMGMRQLHYSHRPDQLFAFATQCDAVLAHPQVPARINEARIGDFLEDLEAFDLVSTFYEDVFCLPPASTISLDAHGMRIQRYWEFAPPEPLQLSSNDAYVDGFLEVFGKAVKTRLRSVGPVGSMLSGGLDSSSVVAVASRQLADMGLGPLGTFSAVGPDPGSCIETRLIRMSSQLSGLAPHVVCFTELEPYFDELERLTRGSADPFDGHMVLPRAVYLMAHRAGMKVLLDGAAGDVTLGAPSQVTTLVAQGRLLEALKEAQAEQHFWSGMDDPGWKKLVRTAGQTMVPEALRQLRRTILQPFWRWRASRHSPLRPDFARQIDMAARRALAARLLAPEPYRGGPPVPRIPNPNLVVGRERYDRVAGELGIEPRDPFTDLRVISYCQSLPPEQLKAGGWPKLLLRRAMVGRLPEEVVWRRGRTHLGHKFIRSVIAGCQAQIAQQPNWLDPLEPFARPDWALEMRQSMAQEKGFEAAAESWYLANWLRARV